MSLDLSRKQIRCDSADCSERLTLPIATPSSAHAKSSSSAGWAFVASIYEDKHFCPHCAKSGMTERLARRA